MAHSPEMGVVPTPQISSSDFAFLDLLNPPPPLSPLWGQPLLPNNNNGEEQCNPEEKENPNQLLLISSFDHLDQEKRKECPGGNNLESVDSFSDTSFSSHSSSTSTTVPDLGVWGISGPGEGCKQEAKELMEWGDFDKLQSSIKISSRKSKHSRPSLNPADDRYKIRRERNNISVRKSRAKTKTKIKEIQERVALLEQENKILKCKFSKVRKFLMEFEGSVFGWRNVIRELEEELSSNAG